MELNKIYNEDCFLSMRRMDSNFIDLTVTSPPYDNLRKYNGFHFDFQGIVVELFRITKQGGVVVWVVGDATIDGDETGTSFEQALFFKEVGFKLYDTMIYKKPGNGSPQKPFVRYSQCFEYMFVFSKGKPATFNPIMVYGKDIGTAIKTKRQKNGTMLRGVYKSGSGCPKPNVWEINNSMNSGSVDKLHFKHPAPFPEELAAAHISTWTNEGDLIYDPFGGSGTTAKMAHIHKRNWILSEISPEYVDLANKRIKPYLQQTTIFD